MKTLSQVRNRNHRCYELCFKAMLYEPAAGNFTLVHGARYIAGILWAGHAWIETNDGQVYDAVDNAYTPASEYMASVIAECRYTKMQAMNHCVSSNHYGPWHDGDVTLIVEGWHRLLEWRNKMRRRLQGNEEFGSKLGRNHKVLPMRSLRDLC
jgi:hypothetical protein